MTPLKNEAVKRLVLRAIRAGNKNPSISQLKTLATAVGDQEAMDFLSKASVRDMVGVKNCVAAIVYGEDPKKVRTGVGAFFGMEGGKEGQIASEKQERIFTPKPVERTTEEQKDIAARKKVEQEDKHPETSDRATVKPAVSEPLKEKTDPKFKKILERGEDKLKEIEKETAVKKASLDLSVYASRIKKGEAVENVLAEVVAAVQAPKPRVFAVINSGDRITMNTPQTGPVDVTFEEGNMTPEGKKQLTGKDPSGNVIMTLPEGTDPMKIKDLDG